MRFAEPGPPRPPSSSGVWFTAFLALAIVSGVSVFFATSEVPRVISSFTVVLSLYGLILVMSHRP